MARRRSGLGGFWLQLTLQTAMLVTAANASAYVDIATIAKPATHTSSLAESAVVLADASADAFVYGFKTESIGYEAPLFEPYESAYEPAYNFHSAMPASDFELLGGPQALYNPDADGWFLPN